MITQQYDYDGHGGSMLAKAVGPNYGVAKSANVVIVRFPVKKDYKTSFTMGAALSGLYDILNDISVNEMSGKAVINLSWGS